MSTPLVYEGKLIFGAWDDHLYALDQQKGALIWKWNNGTGVRHYSPASCIPVADKGVVYIVAPDRNISAIDAATGATLWRMKKGGMRESMGMSADKTLVYGKSMQDSVVAYKTGREHGEIAWKMNCGFGYEHVPSMLVEKDGVVFFGTKSGVVYALDPKTQKVLWKYKVDNSMVNTVKVMSRKEVIVSTMDGRVVLLTTE
jgi:outer membrane protein assembly factor BamB